MTISDAEEQEILQRLREDDEIRDQLYSEDARNSSASGPIYIHSPAGYFPADALDARDAVIAELVDALEWYADTMEATTSSALMALDADNGKLACAALAKAAALK